MIRSRPQETEERKWMILNQLIKPALTIERQVWSIMTLLSKLSLEFLSWPKKSSEIKVPIKTYWRKNFWKMQLKKKTKRNKEKPTNSHWKSKERKSKKSLTNWKNNFKKSRNLEIKVSVKNLDMIGTVISCLNQKLLLLRRWLKLTNWEKLKNNLISIKPRSFKRKNSLKNGSNRETTWVSKVPKNPTKMKEL